MLSARRHCENKSSIAFIEVIWLADALRFLDHRLRAAPI
jgi:hypothetical protein